MLVAGVDVGVGVAAVVVAGIGIGVVGIGFGVGVVEVGVGTGGQSGGVGIGVFFVVVVDGVGVGVAGVGVAGVGVGIGAVAVADVGVVDYVGVVDDAADVEHCRGWRFVGAAAAVDSVVAALALPLSSAVFSTVATITSAIPCQTTIPTLKWHPALSRDGAVPYY